MNIKSYVFFHCRVLRGGSLDSSGSWIGRYCRGFDDEKARLMAYGFRVAINEKVF